MEIPKVVKYCSLCKHVNTSNYKDYCAFCYNKFKVIQIKNMRRVTVANNIKYYFDNLIPITIIEQNNHNALRRDVQAKSKIMLRGIVRKLR